jgi:hypothetical protein
LEDAVKVLASSVDPVVGDALREGMHGLLKTTWATAKRISPDNLDRSTLDDYDFVTYYPMDGAEVASVGVAAVDDGSISTGDSGFSDTIVIQHANELRKLAVEVRSLFFSNDVNIVEHPRADFVYHAGKFSEDNFREIAAEMLDRFDIVERNYWRAAAAAAKAKADKAVAALKAETEKTLANHQATGQQPLVENEAAPPVQQQRMKLFRRFTNVLRCLRGQQQESANHQAAGPQHLVENDDTEYDA